MEDLIRGGRSIQPLSKTAIAETTRLIVRAARQTWHGMLFVLPPSVLDVAVEVPIPPHSEPLLFGVYGRQMEPSDTKNLGRMEVVAGSQSHSVQLSGSLDSRIPKGVRTVTLRVLREPPATRRLVVRAESPRLDRPCNP